MIKIIYSILLVLAIWAFVSWFFVRNIESQSYTVIEEKNGYEVRSTISILLLALKLGVIKMKFQMRVSEL